MADFACQALITLLLDQRASGQDSDRTARTARSGTWDLGRPRSVRSKARSPYVEGVLAPSKWKEEIEVL